VESAKLAKHYSNDALGNVTVSRTDAATNFDFGEWQSDVASRKNKDGTVSFLLISPGVAAFGLEFVVGGGPGRTLVMRDAQHEYIFKEQPPTSD
jgi:hypothetical protein